MLYDLVSPMLYDLLSPMLCDLVSSDVMLTYSPMLCYLVSPEYKYAMSYDVHLNLEGTIIIYYQNIICLFMLINAYLLVFVNV